MAHLGFTIDSSQAAPATAALDKLVAASGKAEEASKRLKTSTESLGRGYERLKQQADTAASMLARVERATGVTGGVRRAAEDIMAYGRELDRLRAKYNPTFAAAQAYERELEGINHAHRVGAIDAREQAAAIAALNAQYRAASAGADQYQASAARASRAGMAHSTNLMFQGQDIAMMALMGQSPAMLALQQGTQVGGIFAQMGSGRAVVQGLTSALGMMLNPLNLATIAFIGLGAAGVQSLMGMIGSTEDATDALETHGEWLDRVLVGYEAAALAARNAADQAMKLPQASVEADTEARHRRALEEQARAIEYLVRKQEDLIERRDTLALGGGLFGDIIRETEQLATFAMSVDMSADEVDRLHSIATKLVNDANVDEETRLWAQGFLDAANEARAAAKDVQQLDAAIRTLPRDVQIRLRVSTEFNNAVAGIASLYRDPRNQFDQDREILKNWLDHANATAQTYGELVGIGNQYTRVLESINAAEEEANKKANARAAKDAAKPFDQWGTAADNFTRGMEQQRMELELLGASTYEIARQRAEFDLLTQAKQAGVDLNMQLAGSEQTVAEWIKQSSAEYAALAVEMERQQEIASGITRFNSMIASTFVDVVMGAKDAGEAFQQLANQLISMAMNRLIMDMLGMMFGMPPGVGGAGIGGRGGLFGGAIIPGILHSGGEAGQDGYGHGRSFPAGLWRNSPRYHNGGVAGLLPNEVPAILQRGERVIPANQNGTQVVKIVLQDDSGRMAQIADQRIETAAGVIVEVSVAQSVRAVRNNQAKMSAEANLRYG